MTANPTFLRLQSVLFNTDTDSLKRAYFCAVNAVAYAMRTGVITGAEFAYGDCSPVPILSQDIVNGWVEEARAVAHVPITYTFFDQNKGSAAGHNTLMALVKDSTQGPGGNSLLTIMNPDVKMSGDTIYALTRTLTKRPRRVGLVEARQLPIEHPKAYDEVSGRTAWISTAMAMTTSDIFWEVGGFDSATFFLYCDDVDFSWLVREKGYELVFQPAAVVFHDKRLNPDGSWPAGQAEKYYSAEAALLLTWKWSRHDKTETYLQYFKESSEEHLLKAAEVFETRRAEGRLPPQRDQGHKVGVFSAVGYGPNRF
jgi:GT2 family glycosyltransferase